LPFLFNFALQYASRRVQVNQKSCFFFLMILIYWMEANILQKNTAALLIASKEVGTEVNAKETKYMIMS